MNLQGVSALVTGGGSGLGEATARALAERGAKVAVFDLSVANAQTVARDIGGIATPGDVASEADAKTAIEKAQSAHGPLRVLVNCAGIANGFSTVGKNGPFPLDQFVKAINVNLVGTFNVIRLCAEAMSKTDPVEGERGVIVNTASIAAFDGQMGQAAYAASKGGVVGMTLPIARDLARFGIRVNTIAPGLFLTPMMKGLPEEAQRSLGAQVSFPSRLGDPREYAMLVLHLCENTMMNGETVRLDGALRMAPR